MRAVVLFAGAGGACLGLREAGVEHALGVEWDESAADTSRAAGFPTVTGDVRDLSIYADVGEVGLLWSSVPCQEFSTAGTRKGAKGDRNGWPWTVDVIDHLAAENGNGPRWFIGENVTGLTMHVGDCPTRDGLEQDDPEACPRCYLDGVIMPQLRARYAWAEWRILDAADYGVPQRRRRVIIAAGPRAIDWPAATHSGEALAVAKWVTGEYWRDFFPSNMLVDCLPECPAPQESRWLAERSQVGLFSTEPPRFGLKPWRTVRQALGLGARVLGGGRNPQTVNGVPVPGDARRLRDITDEPSTTVAAQTGGGAGNAGPFVAGRDGLLEASGRRRLTVAECATLQDFPAGYPFQGTKTSQYRQIGNAVPPTLARVVAEAITRSNA